MLWAFKVRGCVDCGRRPESRDELPEFHCDHRDPAQKQKSHQYGMLANGSLSSASTTMDALLDELMKCDPVCSDCHKVRTKDRLHVAPAVVSDEMRAWMAQSIPFVSGEQQALFPGESG